MLGINVVNFLIFDLCRFVIFSWSKPRKVVQCWFVYDNQH